MKGTTMKLDAKKIVGLAAVAAAVLLSGCSTGPSEEEQKAADDAVATALTSQKNADRAAAIAQTCDTQMSPLLKTLSDLDARLSVGLTESDYGEEVGKVAVDYEGINIDAIQGVCLFDVGVIAEKAVNLHYNTYDLWNGCITDLSCSMDSINSEMQDNWSKAYELDTKAHRGLRDLKTMATEGQKTADEKQAEADQLQADL